MGLLLSLIIKSLTLAVGHIEASGLAQWPPVVDTWILQAAFPNCDLEQQGNTDGLMGQGALQLRGKAKPARTSLMVGSAREKAGCRLHIKYQAVLPQIQRILRGNQFFPPLI